jgi:hypothetical protein
MKILDGGERLYAKEKQFHSRWYTTDIGGGVIAHEIRGEWAAQEIEKRISDVVHVMRDPNPPAPENWIRVTMTKAERAVYQKLLRTSVLELEGKTITAANAGVLWGKLLQLANGAIYYEEGKWVEAHRQKIDALWETLEGLPKPVLIGYGFKHDTARIFQHAPKDLGRFATLKSDASLDAWRRGEIDYGVIHPGSAGHGLNDLYVSGAENLVWFGLTTNREFYEQLNARIVGGHRRTGRSVVIHHIVCDDTIDEDARELLALRDKAQRTAKMRLAAKKWTEEIR